MYKIISTLLLSIFLIACQKDDNDSDKESINGVFAGTFHRTSMDTATVQINFENDRFSGVSSIEKYPAICAGIYSLQNNSIDFSDTCAWTADFDWSLILDGKFSIEHLSEDEIRLFRSNGSITDEYRLKRIIR